VALGSAVRDKSELRGVERPPEFGEKIRAAKLLNLTMDDFDPYLEPDGTVDYRQMVEETGHSLPTLNQYMEELGLRKTARYLASAHEKRRVVLTPEDFVSFKLKNGKISLARATAGLDCCYTIVKRECRRLGLSTAHGCVSQGVCLETVSEALGGLPYKEEWVADRFRNPKTGWRFRFDGYFPDVGLVVEFMGHQHWTFPNAFMDEGHEEVYLAMRERDRIKREMIEGAEGLVYLEIREDEPFEDVMYLRGRLVGIGV